MSLAPLLAAPAVVQIHTATALLALTLGTIVMLMPKGTMQHVLSGRIWAALMLVVAGSSFGITSLFPGHFSPIHILSLITLISVPMAILARRNSNMPLHIGNMIGTYAGLLLAGLFTLMPGRILGAVAFGW